MAADFHSIAFDDATLLKLEIYRRYLETWLPTFVTQRPNTGFHGTINVFDFFCGPGVDKHGHEGSPLIAVRECLKYQDLLENQGQMVNLFFSDSKGNKIRQLESALGELELSPRLRIESSVTEFLPAFESQREKMSHAANLIFIDQCGIKEVTPEVFRQLVALKGTDLLFFVASSYFRRFQEAPEFKRYLDTTAHVTGDTEYRDMHRAIAEFYRDQIPPQLDYYLGSFSLKKGSNINGLIFGSGHLLGIDKFQRICWDLDKERGAANYDIDQDLLPQVGDTMDFFKDKPKKVNLFQEELRAKLRAGEMHTDRDIYKYTLENGFVPVTHAKQVLIELIREGLLECDGQPRLTKTCIKAPRTIRLN